MLRVSARIADYTILQEMDADGCYAAYDARLDRRLVLKVVYPDSLETRLCLRRDAQVMAGISHPNVAKIYEVLSLSDGALGVAMEHVPGTSLRAWLLQHQQAPWLTLRSFFVSAAAGLHAAHEQGLVHHRFSLDHIWVTPEGRVVITGFGYTGDIRASSGSLERDRWTFLTVFFEAVYGCEPSIDSGLSIEEMSVRYPERAHGVPPGVKTFFRRALVGGQGSQSLTMRQIQGALERLDGRPRWYRRPVAWVAGMAAMLTVFLGMGVVWVPPCAAPTEAFADVWSPSASGDIREAFRATGLGYADEAWMRMAPRIDTFVESWSRMYVESCSSTQQGEQHPRIHSLRIVCLQQVREYLGSVIHQLQHVTPEMLDRTTDLVFQLSVEHCRDDATLVAVRQPETAAVRQQVERLRSALHELEVGYEVAAYHRYLEAMEALVRDASASGYGPVEAEARYLYGRFLYRLHDYERAVSNLEQAYLIALGENDMDLASDASRELTWIVGYFLAKPEVGVHWSVSARALARRRSVGGLREAHGLRRLGKLLAFMGNSQEAREHLERAQELYQNNLEGYSVELGETAMDLGTTYFSETRYQEALKHYRRAADIKSAVYGPRHFHVAKALQNTGIALMNVSAWKEAERTLALVEGIYTESGKGPTYEEGMLYHNLGQLAKRREQFPLAMERYTRGLAILREKLGKDHPRTSPPLRGLGDVALIQGQVSDAIAYYKEAVRVSSGRGHDPGYRANAEFALARALREASHHREAKRFAEAAMERYQKRKFFDDVERVRRWLRTSGYLLDSDANAP